MSDQFSNLGELFESVCKSHNNRPSIQLTNGSIMTYTELNSLSNQLAWYLQKNGAVKGDVIAIFNEKKFVSFALMLGALKLGITYTNIDTSSPVERVLKIITKASPVLIFTGEENRHKFRSEDLKVLCYEDEVFRAEIASLPIVQPELEETVTGSQPAYLMFTSGSTGFPKGAVMTHGNLISFIQWAQGEFEISADDVMTNLNPMHFDNSVFDFYASLFNGACLLPVEQGLIQTPRLLLDTLNKLKATLWFSVPSMLVYVLRMRALKKTDLQSMRYIVFGGEGFPKNQLRKLFSLLGDRIRLVNVYGPTETTCICSSFKVSESDLAGAALLPLGRLLNNFEGSVIDESGQEAGINEVGELYLKGWNVGLGYFHDDERTAEVFEFDEEGKKPGLYKTGDLVSLDEQGLFWFHGRKDNQIKRMGFRIELEEIEAALGDFGYIEECGVIFHKEGDHPGRIIAYVVSEQKEELQILTDLRDNLPPYMIPDEVQYLSVIPKNANGKVDRKLLKEHFLRSNNNND